MRRSELYAMALMIVVVWGGSVLEAVTSIWG
jgi:hypothetical protein